jgi:hypothetical protein
MAVATLRLDCGGTRRARCGMPSQAHRESANNGSALSTRSYTGRNRDGLKSNYDVGHHHAPKVIRAILWAYGKARRIGGAARATTWRSLPDYIQRTAFPTRLAVNE